MIDSGFLSVSDFARFSRTTRDTLHHYDKIGLLSPVSRGANNYRYYSGGQLAVINVIRTLRELGMTLAEIQKLKQNLTPERMDEVFSGQLEKIDQKIDEWVNARKLLSTLKESIHTALQIDESAITIQFMPEEAIILGEPNDYSGGRHDYDALLDFYTTISGRYSQVSLNYPVWAMFSEERIRRKDWVWPDRYYFYHSAGQDKRPAALYAIGYTRCGYGMGGALYQRLLDYIDRNGFEICGNAYEEYPLNELCVADDHHYLMRVMITVRAKK